MVSVPSVICQNKSTRIKMKDNLLPLESSTPMTSTSRCSLPAASSNAIGRTFCKNLRKRSTVSAGLGGAISMRFKASGESQYQGSRNFTAKFLPASLLAFIPGCLNLENLSKTSIAQSTSRKQVDILR
jgi:hypothetical protein